MAKLGLLYQLLGRKSAQISTFRRALVLLAAIGLLAAHQGPDLQEGSADSAGLTPVNREAERAIDGSKSASTPRVYVYDLREMIAPAVVRSMGKAMDRAGEWGATHFVIRLNTYGGLVESADSLKNRLLNAPFATVVWIDDNAASAGALISIACEKIYMRKGGRIGAATVVSQDGTPMPDKYQSYMRATMRATAEARGRDPHIAEAMVDPTLSVPGLIDSTKVLTFTAQEAMQYGFCNGLAEHLDQVLLAEGLEGAERNTYQQSSLDKVIGWLMNPAISSVLILIMIGGIYFELQTPGVGFPLLASLVAAVLYFAPLYLEGLAANWEVALFIVGWILLALEVFVIPGFGVAGVLGIAGILGALILALVQNDALDFTFSGTEKLKESVMLVLGTLAVAIVLLFAFGGRFLRSGLFSRLVLKERQESATGYQVRNPDKPSWVGKEGSAITVLRPGGRVEIEGTRLDAVSDDGYLEKGDAIVVIAEESTQVIVKKKV